MISYSKTQDGSWVLRGPPNELREGNTVTVTTKGGKDKQETVGRVFWKGKDREGQDVALAKIVRDPNTGPPASPAQKKAIEAKLKVLENRPGGITHVSEISDEIAEKGGLDRLKIGQASQFIDRLNNLLDGARGESRQESSRQGARYQEPEPDDGGEIPF